MRIARDSPICLIGLALIVVLASCRAAGVERPDERCVGAPAQPEGVTIAGSGAVLPALEFALREYREAYPDRPVYVAESIGSGGALLASQHGSIHIGLVSRPIEETSGLRVTPWLRASVVLVANRASAPSEAEALAVWRGERARWDDGTPAVPLFREAGDSGVRALCADANPWCEAYREGFERRAGPVATTDAQALDRLGHVPGALAFADPAALALNGVATVRVGDERWTRAFALLSREDPTPEAAHVLAYLRSERATRALVEAGYALP